MKKKYVAPEVQFLGKCTNAFDVDYCESIMEDHKKILKSEIAKAAYYKAKCLKLQKELEQQTLFIKMYLLSNDKSKMTNEAKTVANKKYDGLFDDLVAITKPFVEKAKNEN